MSIVLAIRTWTEIISTTSILLGSIVVGGLLGATLVSWLFPPSVVVGVDGVFVRGRFLPYSRISAVHHEHQETVRFASEHGEAGKPWFIWTVSLSLGGEMLVVTRTSRVDFDTPGAEIAYAIERALAAWIAAQNLDVDIVSRGERTGSQWLDALRRLGSGKDPAYRRAAVDVAGLSRLLDDPQAKVSARAAAAVVLVAAGDAQVASRLRIAAESMASPRLRIALESVADGTADVAIAEALETLEEAECEERA